MALKKTQRSLKQWTEQEWGTRSGRPSIQGNKATGEKYLPKATRQAMSKSEYDRLTKLKRKSIKKGEQYSRDPRKKKR
tara:strand:+ start:745 stop:978 length:234 start_codon:yes stop_codon:yes gene_type:complete